MNSLNKWLIFRQSDLVIKIYRKIKIVRTNYSKLCKGAKTGERRKRETILVL